MKNKTEKTLKYLAVYVGGNWRGDKKTTVRSIYKMYDGGNRVHCIWFNKRLYRGSFVSEPLKEWVSFHQDSDVGRAVQNGQFLTKKEAFICSL